MPPRAPTLSTLLAALALAACAAAPQPAPPPLAAAAPSPSALRLDPFYSKVGDAGGIPVTASGRVPDAALVAARGIVDGMLEKRPDIRRQMIAMGERVGVLAPDEMITDLPEERDL